MKIIKQSHQILSISDNILGALEVAGRTCYKSEDKITSNSSEKFVKMLINNGHHAMIEFGDITIKFITNRGVTHELVRHRMCSFAQESTRYVRYDGKMEFIQPVWFSEEILGYHILNAFDPLLIPTDPELVFLKSLCEAEEAYKQLIKIGWQPQQAREVLPNSLKTEIVVKANIREWRHIFSLRCTKAAHPQIRALMLSCMKELQHKLPIIFEDINL